MAEVIVLVYRGRRGRVLLVHSHTSHDFYRFAVVVSAIVEVDSRLCFVSGCFDHNRHDLSDLDPAYRCSVLVCFDRSDYFSRLMC